MNPDIRRFISKHNIHVVRDTDPEIQCLCPWHVEKAPSLYINNRTGKWHCFGCGKKGIIKSEADLYIRPTVKVDYDTITEKVMKKIKKSDYMPLHESSLGLRYWKNRGFIEREIVAFEVEYNKVENRLAFPIFNMDNELEFYIERSIFDSDGKHHIPFGRKKNHFFFNFKNAREFYEVNLAEGPLTVIALGRNTLGMIGKTLSDKQLDMLRSVDIRRITLCLDRDVKQSRIFKIRNKLLPYFEVDISEVPEPYNDWAEMREKQRVDS